MVVDSTTLLLSWSPPNNPQCVTGYEVYNNSVLLDTIANMTSYTINSLYQGIVYSYNVSAIDKKETRGLISEHVVINFSGTCMLILCETINH